MCLLTIFFHILTLLIQDCSVNQNMLYWSIVKLKIQTANNFSEASRNLWNVLFVLICNWNEHGGGEHVEDGNSAFIEVYYLALMS